MPDRIEADIEALLRFYADAGYSDALDDEPHDRFAESAKRVMPRQSAAEPSTQQARPVVQTQPVAPPAIFAPAGQPTIPAEAQAARARELAQAASTLDELRGVLDGFDGCNLKFTAKQTVFSDGNPQAPIMFIGEAPGRDEDMEGLPFLGRAGQLLDRMLAAIGLDRDQAYLATFIPWRPPGNRDPSQLEIEICRPFIERQIELVAPKILVTLGNCSARTILHTKANLMRTRGTWTVHPTAGGVEIPGMPTLNPERLLQTPAHKKLAWRDLLEIKARLKEA
ncbi:uracil-DNA glycosylase [Tianweitania sp. BSSL-BM11]|uniref:Type-4 uracil-DNA glycosylase n=1 Tax=Tianweitania aestuarii TaxID=2814886 RepID=A0ABS5RSE9_9HYPH|nr:uracil-DNA glycosylase [Tianweitania aestuarii]MBS9719914.1 uracil-DNA glycosylase [Tianweitania aestuarii]